MQSLAAPTRCPSAPRPSGCGQRLGQRLCAVPAAQHRILGAPARRQAPPQQQRQRRPLPAAASSLYGAEWSTPQDAYLTVGLSLCYAKNSDGKLVEQLVIEPLTANSLEAMQAGAATSFKHVFSLKLGEALERSKAALPAEFADGFFCEDFETRCDASARTWMRPHAMDNLLDIVPLGQLKSNFNFSTANKRVLNAENVVNDDDNIKQDLSIDVYGRKGKEEAAEAAEAKEAAAAEGEEDDMDALLSV